MTAFNELTVSALLWSTGRETLGVVVFFLHYEGNSPAAAAVATISVAVTLVLAGAGEPARPQPARRSGAVASVSFEGVSKRFGRDARRRWRRASTIADGEFFALLGPSGCGKTTLLRLVAGFEAPDDGAGQARRARSSAGRAWPLPPERRRIGMVFQSYALWPHMTRRRECRLFAARAPRAAGERERRVAEALAMVGLEPWRTREPHELSGGQRQRVALARCLAMRPARRAAGRAARQSRRASARGDAAGVPPLPPRDRRDLRLRHPRPGRSDGARRPRRRDGRRPGRADRRRRARSIASPRPRWSRASSAAASWSRYGWSAGTGRTVVDLWGVSIARSRQGGARRRSAALCLRAEDLGLAKSGAPNAIPGRVVATAYQGATTLLTIAPQAEGAPELRVEHAGEIPALGASVAVDARDGWIIPV